MKTNNRAPRVRGARALVAMLPNGRSVWLNLRPAPVPVREFDRIANAIRFKRFDRARRLDANAAATRRFSRRLTRDTARLSRMRLKKEHKLRNRILTGDEKIGRRVDSALIPVIREVETNRKKQKEILRKHQRRELWNQLVVLSAAPLMAAYGQRSNPIAENNLVLALSLAVWLFGDEAASLLSGKPGKKEDSIKGLDVWSYTAPLANLLTGWWLLSGRQHERFITGVTDLKNVTVQDFVYKKDRQRHLYAALSVEDLSPRIAPDHLQDFRTLQNVPAVATIQSVEFADESLDLAPVSLLETAVIYGHLRILVQMPSNLPALKKLQVAWMVDTQDPAAKPLSGKG
ncbi:MAG: hypothetical protein HKP58_04855 [Desulfatitalea sp.]|nr:hypothetical protein [Desulfatitalea sp.]NNJ99722.1 hypothetical protein [Desulfatitalea sp.]